MKKCVKYIAILVLFVLACFFFINSRKQVKTINDLININELSPEFMDNYFNEASILSQSENKDNILIVIADKEIKDTYGASKVVKGPNNQYYILYETEEDKNNALDKLGKNKNVLSVEENVTLSLSDTAYNSWGITKMDLDDAITTANSLDLPEVLVAVIDSGVNTSLANRYYSGKIKATYNVLTNETNIMTDEYGHGTHVFGTVAEGTPSNVKIIPVKVTTGQTLSLYDLVTAINYVTYDKKVDVINLSLGGNNSLESLAQAITAANAENIVVVAAAGNDNTSANYYPAAYSNTIGISSVDSSYAKSDFSNYGSYVTFAAPGSYINSIMSKNSTIAQNNGNNSGDDFETISGTSMATPHASAAIAILKSYNKNLTMDNVVLLLRGYVKDLGATGWDQYFGYGFINFTGAEFCTDGINCDQYGVFKKIVKSIEATPSTTTYNYGSITNILGSTIRIWYNNIDYEDKKLEELDDLTISGYNPYTVGNQTVTLTYGGKTTTMTINHSSGYTLGWTYTVLDNKVTLTGYKDSNKHIKKLYVPNKINNQDVVAIENCFNSSSDIAEYKEIILPSTLTRIGQNAFVNKTSIEKVTSLASSIDIGASAFSGDSSLVEFVGSPGVINSQAFQNCTNLEYITLDNNTTSIGNGAFYNTKLSSIIIPRNVSTIYSSSFGGSALTSIAVDTNNAYYDSRNNCNCIIETSTNTLIKGLYNTVIPATVTTIGTQAFYGDTKITNVVIPNNITSIGSYAYGNCSNINNMTIPRSVTTIGDHAFYNTNVTIWTYYDAFARNYAYENSIRYETYSPSKVEVATNKDEYVAFEEVSETDINSVTLYYSRAYYNNNVYTNELYANPEITSNYTITYQNGNHFNYGDTYYTISGTNSINEQFSKNVTITVVKATPTYTVPNNIEGIIGNSLALVSLPNNFEWMDSSVILTDNTVPYYARYIPDDTNNYTIVENIPIPIDIRSNKLLLEPNIVISNKTYDGTTNIDSNTISITNLSPNDYTITSAYTNLDEVGNRTAYVTIRLSDIKYANYYLEGEVQEKEYTVDITIDYLKINKPVPKNITYTYNGLEQTMEFDGFDSNTMIITENIQTEPGTYSVSIGLNNANYTWSDDSRLDLSFDFVINKIPVVTSDNTTDQSIIYDSNYHTINPNISMVAGAIIKYKDSNNNYTLNEPPKYKEKGLYSICYQASKDNYHTIYTACHSINIYIGDFNVTTNNYVGYYDGKSHTISITSDVTGVTFKYGSSTTNYNLSSLPSYTNIGTYNIYYQASKTGYNTKYGSGSVTIYGIKDFSNKITNKNNTIIVKNETFNNIKNTINEYVYSNTTNYYHYNISKMAINDNSIKTGDSIHIVLNNTKNYDYKFAYMGDTTGDGKINYLDYVSVYNHIQKTKHPDSNKKLLKDEYLIAADISEDDKINYMDYVKIYNKIKELKGGA